MCSLNRKLFQCYWQPCLGYCFKLSWEPTTCADEDVGSAAGVLEHKAHVRCEMRGVAFPRPHWFICFVDVNALATTIAVLFKHMTWA